MVLGPRSRLNVRLTSTRSGRHFVLPLEVFIAPEVAAWWQDSEPSLLEEMLSLIARNSHVLSKVPNASDEMKLLDQTIG